MMNYTVKQKIMAFGKQYRAFDGSGNQIYEIRSMILSPERRKEVYDMAGRLVAWSEWPVMSEHASLVAGAHGGSLEVPFMSLTPEWNGSYDSAASSISGDFFRRNFDVRVGGRQAATIGKEFFAFSDTYEVNVDESMMAPEIVLLLVAIIDHKYHSDKN